MSATVVVPCHNRGDTLSGVLRALARQTAVGHFDVVVIDDNSRPPIGELLSAHGWPFAWKLERREEAGGSVARARNLGTSRAHGEVVLFLDADVLPSPTTVEQHLSRHRGLRAPHLVMSAVYGHEAVPGEIALRVPAFRTAKPSGVDVERIITDCRRAAAAEDPRAGRFDAFGDRLESFPAPWAWCWTLAVSCPRSLAEAHPFDENFRGKGSEDLEWGLRLHNAGVGFAFEREAPVLHWPHERDRYAEIEADRFNLLRFLGRHPRYEVEALAVLDCVLLNDALPALRDLVQERDRAIPESAGDAAVLGELLERAGPRRLLIGAADGRWDPLFSARCEPARQWRRPETVPLVGVATPFATRSFDVAVIGSLWLSLSEAALAHILQEALRVAAEVWLYGPDPAAGDRSTGLAVRRRHRAYTDLPWPYWAKGRHFSTELEDFCFGPDRELPSGSLRRVGWNPRLSLRLDVADPSISPLEIFP